MTDIAHLDTVICGDVFAKLPESNAHTIQFMGSVAQRLHCRTMFGRSASSSNMSATPRHTLFFALLFNFPQGDTIQSLSFFDLKVWHNLLQTDYGFFVRYLPSLYAFSPCRRTTSNRYVASSFWGLPLFW